MSCERKRVVVSIEIKLKALEQLDKGQSVKSVALGLGVGETTVKDLVKPVNRSKLIARSKASQVALQSRCTLINLS